MDSTESRPGRNVGGAASTRKRRKPSTLVRYRLMESCDDLPDEPTPLMRCEETERVSALVEGLSKASHAVSQFLQQHDVGPGCECEFCLACPLTKDLLNATVECLDQYIWMIDNSRLPTAAELAELRQIDAAYLECNQADVPNVVKPR